MTLEVQEVLRKLKPIIGKRVERYWIAYLSEDHEGRQELETAFRLMAAKLLGSEVETLDVPLSAPPKELAQGEYPLGQVMYSGRPLHGFGLREDEWIQHTAIFGRSGAGKTNTVFAILDGFLDRKKPFLIFDWKRNYRDLLSVRNEEILVYTVGRDTAPFVFNPLIPPEGTDPTTWLKKLIEIFAHSYYLGEGVMYLLLEALDTLYEQCGAYRGAPRRYPTFVDLLEWLEAHPVKGRKALWMDSTLRGVKSICYGHMGRVVNTAVQPNLGSLLGKNVILELDGLTNADKTLITEALLLWIHHYRMAQGGRETFKHVMVIEEAHHILLKRTGSSHGGEALTDTILREIRELGEAIVLVDQHPSLISVPALGNTYTTIAMNLKHQSDVSAVGAAMLLGDDERGILGRLPVGSAAVKLQGRWLEPFVIQIPHRRVPKGSVTDAVLAGRMQRYRIRVAPPESQETELTAGPKPQGSCDLEEEPPAMVRGTDTILAEPAASDSKPSHQEVSRPPLPAVTVTLGISQREELFLRDVHEHPLSGTVERYRNLKVSRRKGNIVRQSLVDRGLVKLVDIRTRGGKTVLLELTRSGREILRNLGIDVPERSRWGSLEHEFWKHKASEKLRADGWLVKVEEPLPGSAAGPERNGVEVARGYTDIVAEKDGQRIAVEIETGESDWRKNVEKNLRAKFSRIIILATSIEGRAAVLRAGPEMTSDISVEVVLAQDFVESNGPPAPELDPAR